MKQSSLFNAIYPIMIGPSSSHTAGAVRLGLLARNIFGNNIKNITFKLYNSYAQTGFGHGTDKGLLAGILGLKVDDIRIKNIFNLPEAKNLNYKFEYLEDFNRHPNSVDFIMESDDERMYIVGNSIGAGNVRIIKINDFSVKISGEYNTLVINYKDVAGMISKVTGLIQLQNINIASLICDRNAKGEEASMCICLDKDIDLDIVEKIKLIPDVYFVKNVKKLES
ncbi:L-serine ammonia-lyase, iron-sulfur-dependent subunit beta [bacterium]|nr:L-serine ammonia-lyase, iron-sulfur-dependent subunit beta [bacterium]